MEALGERKFRDIVGILPLLGHLRDKAQNPGLSRPFRDGWQLYATTCTSVQPHDAPGSTLLCARGGGGGGGFQATRKQPVYAPVMSEVSAVSLVSAVPLVSEVPLVPV